MDEDVKVTAVTVEIEKTEAEVQGGYSRPSRRRAAAWAAHRFGWTETRTELLRATGSTVTVQVLPR